jgi:hypothetical protein
MLTFKNSQINPDGTGDCNMDIFVNLVKLLLLSCSIVCLSILSSILGMMVYMVFVSGDHLIGAAVNFLVLIPVLNMILKIFRDAVLNADEIFMTQKK